MIESKIDEFILKDNTFEIGEDYTAILSVALKLMYRDGWFSLWEIGKRTAAREFYYTLSLPYFPERWKHKSLREQYKQAYGSRLEEAVKCDTRGELAEAIMEEVKKLGYSI